MNPSPELEIKWEWEPAPSVRAPEHRATWARVEVWVGKDCVTLVEDRESGSSRRSIYCSLYPVAEWVAYNWWLLRADARPARGFPLRLGSVAGGHYPVSHAQLRRHSVRASGDGFLWPELLIVPEGRQTHLIWQRDRAVTEDQLIAFLSQGEALVDPGAVERELGRLVSSVLTRLAEEGVTGTLLDKEWAEIQQTEPAEEQYCLAAARLGLDPYSEAGRYEQEILRASENLSGDLRTDFLDGVDPANIDLALRWIDSARNDIEKAHASREDAAPALRDEARSRGRLESILPWEQGWQQARRVRDILGVEDSTRLDLGGYIRVVRRNLHERSVLAVGGTIKPVVVMGQQRTGGSRRFTLSRALWRYLWEREPLFLVTSTYTDRQKVERAFAAELLAPARGIAELLQGQPETAPQEDVDQIAEHFGVSSMVIQHQLQNQLLTNAS